jgi:hypothetical protein
MLFQMMPDNRIEEEWAAVDAKSNTTKPHPLHLSISLPQEPMHISIISMQSNLQKCLGDITSQSKGPTPKTQQHTWQIRIE